MKLLTKWLHWFVKGRNEHKFHVDLLLRPCENVYITCGDHTMVIGSPDQWAKVHLAASWEFRPTEFVEE